MRNRPGSSSLVASPILVGAVTCLVGLIAVFLSYNANEGLPFVPTYHITAQVQDAAGLVAGNEVRIGGKRVGVIEEIDAQNNGQKGVSADLKLKLDKYVQPLRYTTQVTVRPRSTLGLKYLEIEPGKGGKEIPEGGKLALAQSQPVVDLDEVVNGFDAETRKALQGTIHELGPGFAGRGVDLNAAISDGPELFTYVDRVMANLADPNTRLQALIDGLETTASAVAPVAPQLGRMITSADTTFAALETVRPEIGQILDEAPSTEAVATQTLAQARPLLEDSTTLLREARPGVQLLPTAANKLDHAIDTGVPVLNRAVGLADELKSTLGAVERLSSDPLTRIALARLSDTLDVLAPGVAYLTPAQTQCNILGVWTRNVDSSISEGDSTGNWFRTVIVAGVDQLLSSATPAPDLHMTPYPHTAAPGQGGECEAGNETYEPGQHVGHPAGVQGRSTEDTKPPAGVGQG
jgi:virulence factor Mce-like protein